MPPLIIPPVGLSGVTQISWMDPTLTERDLTYLTSPNLFMAAESVGLGGVTIEVAASKIPFASGDLARHLAVQAKRLEIPLFVRDDTFGDLMVTMRAVRTWFRTGDERRRTPGYLIVTTPDSQTRWLQCYYTGGLETPAKRGPNWAMYVVSLYAPDPYPRDPNPTLLSWDTGDIPGQIIVMNTGDLDAYPIWTVTGPAAAIQYTYVTPDPDEAFDLGLDGGLTLAGGESVTIDTRPDFLRGGALQVRDQDGDSLYNHVDPNSSFFWLVPGENRVNWTWSGTSGATELSLQYFRRFDGLLY